MEQRSLPINQRNTIVWNYVEKNGTDYETLKKLQPIGNSLCIFMGNMLIGRHFEKAQVIAESLTEDVKILALTEATTEDIDEAFRPILIHFKEISIFSPCNQAMNGPKKAEYHLVLIDGSNVNGLGFSLHVSTLYISVLTIKDSQDKLAL